MNKDLWGFFLQEMGYDCPFRENASCLAEETFFNYKI